MGDRGIISAARPVRYGWQSLEAGDGVYNGCPGVF